MRTVLVVTVVWVAVAFLLGPLIGRVLKYGHIRPTTGPPPLPPDPLPPDPLPPDPEATPETAPEATPVTAADPDGPPDPTAPPSSVPEQPGPQQ